MPGAIALGLMGSQSIWNKLSRGWKTAANIDAGNLAPYLPAAERPYFEQVQHRQQQKQLPSGSQSDNTTDATTNGTTDSASNSAIQPPNSTPESAESHSVPSSAPALPLLNLDELTHHPSLILYGPQGSGKSTLARAIAQHRQQRGHTIDVLNPHGAVWGFPVIGGGMDYEAIASHIRIFKQKLIERYRQFAYGQKDFEPYTLIADKFTNWSNRLDADLAIEFVRAVWTDVRKVNCHAIFISHTNTLEGGLARSRGLAQLRDSGCVQIQLFTQMAKDGRAVPTGEAISCIILRNSR